MEHSLPLGPSLFLNSPVSILGDYDFLCGTVKAIRVVVFEVRHFRSKRRRLYQG